MEICSHPRVNEFIKVLDNKTYSRVIGMLQILSEKGPYLHMPFAKKIDKRLYELRIIGKLHIRILYTFVQNEIFLLHIFYKKTNKIPLKEIHVAYTRLKELL